MPGVPADDPECLLENPPRPRVGLSKTRSRARSLGAIDCKHQGIDPAFAHAWQIANDTFTPAYYCKALSTAIGTVGGDMSAYTYGPAGQSWGSFGTEQQASIVDEWFAGKLFPEQDGAPQRQRAFEPMSSDADGNAAPNPYFGYIRDNIRAGIV